MTRQICIYPPLTGLGGPASFQSRLIAGLSARGISVTHDIDQENLQAVLMMGGTHHLDKLHNARRSGARIVQRLAGLNWVHWRTRTGVKHFLRAEYGNLVLSLIRRWMADRVVYQSRFCEAWWHRERGRTPAMETVIHNGIDLGQFSPGYGSTAPMDHIRILLVEGRLGGGYHLGLIHVASLAEELEKDLRQRVELVVVGQVPASLKQSFTDTKTWITWKGSLPREEISAEDRSAHLLFSGDLQAACPNSVIEALACGTPVIGFNTGALSELVDPSCGRLAPYGSDPWKMGPANIPALVEAAKDALINLPALQAGARARAVSHFDINQVVERYMEVLLS